MRSIWYWLVGWYVTLQIKYSDPDLYRALSQPLYIDDFEEVNEP